MLCNLPRNNESGTKIRRNSTQEGTYMRGLILLLHEQARREARKTHKEKVDTFNKYLDSLSEHHDMPRIGPG